MTTTQQYSLKTTLNLCQPPLCHHSKFRTDLYLSLHCTLTILDLQFNLKKGGIESIFLCSNEIHVNWEKWLSTLYESTTVHSTLLLNFSSIHFLKFPLIYSFPFPAHGPKQTNHKHLDFSIKGHTPTMYTPGRFLVLLANCSLKNVLTGVRFVGKGILIASEGY